MHLKLPKKTVADMHLTLTEMTVAGYTLDAYRNDGCRIYA